VPIEVTAQTALRRAFLPALRTSGPLGQLLTQQAEVFAEEYRYEESYGRTCSGLPDDIINFQHDPLACAVALGWDGFRTDRLPVQVAIRDGWLQQEAGGTGRTLTVVTEVEGARFNDFWLRTLTA
jgi:hypothetical protein